METNSPKEPFTTESAREHLKAFFGDQLTRNQDKVDPQDISDFTEFKTHYQEAIDQLIIIPGSIHVLDKKALEASFIKKVFETSAFHNKLMNRYRDELFDQLSKADTSSEIFTSAEKFNFINKGGVDMYFRNSGDIPVSVREYRQMTNEIFFDVDPGLVSLLNIARKYIKENHPKESFVLIKEDGDRRLGFGVMIEDGVIESVGLNYITAPCQAFRFDTVKDSLPNVEEGVKLMQVKNKFIDYPTHFNDPYILPADLFLLKSTTEWGSCPLNGTKVEKEVEAGFVLE